MNIGKGFATFSMCLALGASAGYALDRDWRHVIYWAAAAVLTASVTF